MLRAGPILFAVLAEEDSLPQIYLSSDIQQFRTKERGPGEVLLMPYLFIETNDTQDQIETRKKEKKGQELEGGGKGPLAKLSLMSSPLNI